MPLPLVADGLGYDRALAALFCSAKQGETVSLQAARAQAANKAWGCILCRVLDAVVAKNHCPDTLAGQDTPTIAAYRAGAALLLLAAALWSVPLLAFFAIRAFV